MQIIRRNTAGFWNFYKHGITQSLIGKYRACPVQCKLAYYDGLSSRSYKANMHFGNTVHHVLACAYTQHNASPPEGLVHSYIQEYQEIWEAEQREHCREFNIAEQAKWDKIYAMAEAVCPVYFRVYASDFKKDMLFAEKEFKIPYTFSSYNGAEVNTFLRGKIDLAYTESNGNITIHDHKCMEQINIDALKNLLPYDTQCNMYLLAVYKMLGKFPTHIYKNIIRIPQSKPKEGESPYNFSKRFNETVEKDPSHYFSRIKLQIAPEEILQWEKNWLVPNLQEIHHWFNSGCRNKTINPDALLTKYGVSEYLPLISVGLVDLYYKRKRVFPELSED